MLSKSRYEPRLRATPRKRVVYEPRALSAVYWSGAAIVRTVTVTVVPKAKRKGGAKLPDWYV